MINLVQIALQRILCDRGVHFWKPGTLITENAICRNCYRMSINYYKRGPHEKQNNSIPSDYGNDIKPTDYRLRHGQCQRRL